MAETGHKCGWVAIMGPPNAGKSTLLNTLCGQKLAIVTPKPQTTRNQISGILTRPDAQIVFLDTPGLHEARGAMNRFMVQAAWQALSGGDVILLVLDAPQYAARPESMDKDLALLREPVLSTGRPVLAVLNKVDKIRDKQVFLPVMDQMAKSWPAADIHPVSALTGDGVDALLEAVIRLLPQGGAMYPEDQVSTLPVRFMAAEIVREKLFLALRQELPYSTAVGIEAWEESQDGDMVRIHAEIYVTRRNHKAMVIGQGGRNLKQIGIEARKDIEELLGQRVYLELFVKVREGWTEDAGFLRAMGLGV